MEPLAHSNSGHETQTDKAEELANAHSVGAAHEPHRESPLTHADVSKGMADTESLQLIPSPVIAPSQSIPETPMVNGLVSEPVGLSAPAGPVNPVAVVRVLSPTGVEYVFMTISLFMSAGGLTGTLLAVVNDKTDFQVLSFPTAVLLVGVPVFALLFLRLKKRELLQPTLKLDPSKRRSTQFTQIVCFLICIFTLVGLVSTLFAKLGGQTKMSLVKVVLDCLVLLAVFGGMLVYYWRDEHAGR